jgi:hypothetical protein
MPKDDVPSRYAEVVARGLEEGLDHDGQRVHVSPYRHGPFGPEVRARLQELHDTLCEVHPLTLDEWEDGFRRDTTPEREIALWLHFAQAYRRVTTQRLRKLQLAHKQVIFHVLLAGMAGRERAAERARELGLPDAIVDIVLAEAFPDPMPVDATGITTTPRTRDD